MDKLSVRFNVEKINTAADIISKYGGVDRSKVIRAALNIGLAQMAAAPEAMAPDELFLMVHKSQELELWT